MRVLPYELGQLLESLIRNAGNFLAKSDWEAGNSNTFSVHEPPVSPFDHQIEQRLFASEEIGETEKMQLAKARVGQGVFRDRVHRIERECRVAKIENPAFLIASHIKPWRNSNNNERLDANNGLMLSPDVDRLFDGGFISFGHDGVLLISPIAPREDVQKMGISPVDGQKCGLFTEQQNDYLEYHRNNRFLIAGKAG